MKVRINSTPNKNKTRGIDTQKWTLACIYCITQWVELGLWDRCILYAHPQISYHMHAKTAYYMHGKQVRIICTLKSIFAYQYHEFLFLFGILFICIFMRPGSLFSKMISSLTLYNDLIFGYILQNLSGDTISLYSCIYLVKYPDREVEWMWCGLYEWGSLCQRRCRRTEFLHRDPHTLLF